MENQTAVQEETQEEVKPKGLHAKILAVMNEVNYIQKDMRVPVGGSGYKAVSETKITSVVRQSMIRHQLTLLPIHQVVTHNPAKRNVSQVEITYRLTDAESGEHIEIVSAGEGSDSQDKAIGKALTYAYKYALLRTFAIPTGEDPDQISSEEITKNEAMKHQKALQELGEVYQELTNRGMDASYLANTAMSCIGRQFQSFEQLSVTELYNIKAVYQTL